MSTSSQHVEKGHQSSKGVCELHVSKISIQPSIKGTSPAGFVTIQPTVLFFCRETTKKILRWLTRWWNAVNKKKLEEKGDSQVAWLLFKSQNTKTDSFECKSSFLGWRLAVYVFSTMVPDVDFHLVNSSGYIPWKPCVYFILPPCRCFLLRMFTR